MNMEIELKPCPFCGSTELGLTSVEIFNSLMTNPEGDRIAVEVHCCNCSIDAWVYPKVGTTYQQAVTMMIDRWNTRYECES